MNIKNLLGEIKTKPITIAIIFIISLSVISCSSENEDIKKNSELMKIENKIIKYISKGKLDEAYDLLDELDHPSSEEWEEKEKSFFSNYTYNEWWNIRREELRAEILKKENKNLPDEKRTIEDDTSIENSNKKNIKNDDLQNNDTTNIDLPKIVKINSKYLGLYIFQSENGNTQFYKFISSSNRNKTTVLYQDNINGNINIEKYDINSFNSKTGILNLTSKKNNTKTISLLIKRDVESNNGYKVIDKDGIIYTFVSH